MTLAYPSLEQMRGELRVGEEFLAKYNRPGPRYTSYPTAPVWNDSFGPGDLERVFGEAESAKTPVSLYMHIPFCESLCLFCACNVVIQKNKSVAPPYLDVLKQEMKRISRSVSKTRPIVQFHWGGGTPTYLTPEQIEDLFAFTKEHFHFDPDSEIGIEVDPRVTSGAHLETLRKLGFNRLSMGIQDFHRFVGLQAMNCFLYFGMKILDAHAGFQSPEHGHPGFSSRSTKSSSSLAALRNDARFTF